MLKPTDIEAIKRSIVTKLKTKESSNTSSSSTSCTSTESSRLRKFDKLMGFASSSDSNSNSNSSSNSNSNSETRPLSEIEFEMQAFLQVPITDTPPLIWWKQYQTTYPRLCEYAMHLFGIVATSAPCERAFSKAGQVISRLRNRLDPDVAAAQIIVASNLDIVTNALDLVDEEKAAARVADNNFVEIVDSEEEEDGNYGDNQDGNYGDNLEGHYGDNLEGHYGENLEGHYGDNMDGNYGENQEYDPDNDLYDWDNDYQDVEGMPYEYERWLWIRRV